MRLLFALLALQGAFTLLTVALRPYISAVLNIIEVACGCLDAAYLALTIAAYRHTPAMVAVAVPGGQGQGDAYLAVRLHLGLQMAAPTASLLGLRPPAACRLPPAACSFCEGIW